MNLQIFCLLQVNACCSLAVLPKYCVPVHNMFLSWQSQPTVIAAFCLTRCLIADYPGMLDLNIHRKSRALWRGPPKKTKGIWNCQASGRPFRWDWYLLMQSFTRHMYSDWVQQGQPVKFNFVRLEGKLLGQYRLVELYLHLSFCHIATPVMPVPLVCCSSLCHMPSDMFDSAVSFACHVSQSQCSRSWFMVCNATSNLMCYKPEWNHAWKVCGLCLLAHCSTQMLGI